MASVGSPSNIWWRFTIHILAGHRSLRGWFSTGEGRSTDINNQCAHSATLITWTYPRLSCILWSIDKLAIFLPLLLSNLVQSSVKVSFTEVKFHRSTCEFRHYLNPHVRFSSKMSSLWGHWPVCRFQNTRKMTQSVMRLVTPLPLNLVWRQTYYGR